MQKTVPWADDELIKLGVWVDGEFHVYHLTYDLPEDGGILKAHLPGRRKVYMSELRAMGDVIRPARVRRRAEAVA